MERQIVINGQHNKYQLKKMLGDLLREHEFKEKKQQVDILFYNPDFNSNIIEYLHQIKDKHMDIEKDRNKDEDKEHITNVILTDQIECEIIKNIHTKMSGYKNQDIKKKVFGIQLFITQHKIIDLIIDQELKCFYCSSVCIFFHKFVREKMQWTLDRIDNSKGHCSDNVILSCLKCNLTRRNQDKNKFYQGKNLKLVKIHN